MQDAFGAKAYEHACYCACKKVIDPQNLISYCGNFKHSVCCDCLDAILLEIDFRLLAQTVLRSDIDTITALIRRADKFNECNCEITDKAKSKIYIQAVEFCIVCAARAEQPMFSEDNWLKLIKTPGINLNIVDEDDSTILHDLAHGGFSTHLVCVLGVQGLKMTINTTNKAGETPLDLVNPDDTVMIELMRSWGAKTGRELKVEWLIEKMKDLCCCRKAKQT
jgi:hypothetical protein